jgi:phosphoenolpyruvate-protein kinase (PTS system EI component)
MPERMLSRARCETGVSIVEGIAVGHAIVWASDPRPRPIGGTVDEERTRVSKAVASATRGVAELIRHLPPSEAQLFEPELVILDDVRRLLQGRVAAGGRAEDAVNEITTVTPTDLLVDVRLRLLDALACDARSVESLLSGHEGDRVLVTRSLTPSVVASLPSRVVAVVAAASEGPGESRDGYTSHAAILARARDIPLASLPMSVVEAITDADHVIVDTTRSSAVVSIEPSDSLAADAYARRKAWIHARAEEDAFAAALFTTLPVEVHVNVGSIHERIPTSAEGIGLVRTELLFSDRRVAPSVAEQTGQLRILVARVGRSSVTTVRLFDAGGDKPIPWLPTAHGPGEARGIALLLKHPDVLDDQLRAIAGAAERGNVRVLLPFVSCPEEVEQVRARTNGRLSIGAMIETPAAVDRVAAIAAVADFVSIGTNDLASAIADTPRTTSALSLDPALLAMIERVVEAAHARGRKVSVCGELAAESQGARILVGLGVDVLSVATVRLGAVKRALCDVTLEDCRGVARAAMA